MSISNRSNLFLISSTVLFILIIISSLSPIFAFQEKVSNYRNNDSIVLIGKALLLKQDFSPLYINVSTSIICPGRTTIFYDENMTKYYSYGYACEEELKEPFLEIKYSKYQYLNITSHTPSYVEVLVELPVVVNVKLLVEKSNYVLLEMIIMFNCTRFSDIISKEANWLNPRYVFLNNSKFNVNDTVRFERKLLYYVNVSKYNNVAYINNTYVGFFPFYITTPINAKDIENFVDMGILEFTGSGFRGRFLQYMNIPLYLVYSGPNTPLTISSDHYIQFKPYTGYYYVYEPDPLFIIEYEGKIEVEVPGIKDAYMYPFKYNSSQIIEHINRFKLIKLKYTGISYSSSSMPLIYVKYLYRYPVRLNAILPLYNSTIMNASYIYFAGLELSNTNLTKILGYKVGFLNKKYLTIHQNMNFKLICLLITIALIITYTVYKIWRRKRY